MTDLYQPAQQADPAETVKLRRWPWIFAAIVAVLVGIAIGSAGKDVEEDRRAQQLAAQTAAVEEREAVAGQREVDASQKQDSLASRSADLDARQAELDQISTDLAEREQALLPKELAAAQARIEGDGVYVVGTDIAPGTYRTAGGSFCYWERSSGTSGELNEILANSVGEGQNVVTIAPSDVAFTSQGCGSWELVN